MSIIPMTLEYAAAISTWNYDSRLSVVAFNERAITVYKRAGFSIDREVTNSYYKNKFYIMISCKT